MPVSNKKPKTPLKGLRKILLRKILLLVVLVSIVFAIFFIFGFGLTPHLNGGLTYPVLAQNYNFGEEKIENINLPKNIDLIMTIIKIINWSLGFLALIAIILVIWAGYLWMTAGGNAKQVEKAKKILINALIGLVIILLSWTIVMYVFRTLERIVGPGPSNPCSPSETCVACDWYCNAQGLTEYRSDICHTPALCGSLPPPEIFKINSITTSCDNPPNYRQAVHRCSAIVINFNHWINSETVKTAVESQPDNLFIEKCDSSSNLYNCNNPTRPTPVAPPIAYSGSTPLANEPSWSSISKTVTFTHPTTGLLFEANTYYSLTIPKTIKDTADNLLNSNNACGLVPFPGCVENNSEVTWIFGVGETLDNIPPSIISTYPINEDDAGYPDRNVNLRPIIWARFNEAILPSSVNKNNVVITGIDATDPDYSVDVNLSGNGFEIYDLILEPFKWYQIDVSGIQDLCNNTMISNKTWQFQTNSNPHGVRTIYPRNDYQYACPDTPVFIIFNTSMYNPASGRCDVNPDGHGGYVTGGGFNPTIGGKNLRVIDDYPGPPSDPNNYCKTYEFLPTNIQFNVNTTYSVGVTTNMVINQTGDVLNYGDIPPLSTGTLSQGPWHFKVLSAEQCVNEPVITGISPDYGPDGECITVFGRYFDPDNNGQGTGDSITFNRQQLTIDSTAWSDNQIATTIPSPSGLNPGNYPIQVTVTHPGPIGALLSNEYNFRLTDDPAAQGPCLWSIKPETGCNPDKANLNGVRFGNDPGAGNRSTNQNNVEFSSNIRVPDNRIDTWLNNKISLVVPQGAQDGMVILTASGHNSNPVYFDISCGEGSWCFDNIQMCVNGNPNCAVGYECLPSGTQCRCREIVGPSEKYLKIIRTNQCDPLAQPNPILPSPNPQPDAQWICLNTKISLRFNERINLLSVNENTFIVEECSNLSATGCQGWSAINGSRTVFDVPNQYGGILFTPVNNFKQETPYRVTVTTGITSLLTKSLKEDYTWEFVTQSLSPGQSGTCPVNYVIVEPSNALLNYLAATQNYQSLPVSSQENGCAILTGDYVWNWNSTDPTVATINNVTIDSNTATALAEGTTKIEATAQNKTGRANLKVEFGVCSNDADCNACPGSICDLDIFRCTPSITSLNPNQGSTGRWITLQGCYFKPNRGSGHVDFGSIPVTIYPCGEKWSDTEILVQVPDITSSYPVIVTDQYGLNSNNNHAYGLINGCLANIPIPITGIPGLCAIKPNYGQENSLIRFEGENLTNDPVANNGGIYFNNGSLVVNQWGNWTNNLIRDVQVPVGVNSDLAMVEIDGCPSNGLYFSLIGNSCDGDTQQDLCQVNQSMCGHGLVCDNDPTHTNTYCTCQLPEPPEPPSPVNVISASIFPYPATECRNSVVGATFDQLMNGSTLNTKSIELWERLSGTPVDQSKCLHQSQLASNSPDYLNKKIQDRRDLKILNKILAKIKDWLSSFAWAQTDPWWCPVAGRVSSYNVNNGVNHCSNPSGCTTFIFSPSQLLNKGRNLHQVIIRGGDNGVKSALGGRLNPNKTSTYFGEHYFWLFTPGEEICLIDHIKIIPDRWQFITSQDDPNDNDSASPNFDTIYDADKVFRITPYAKSGEHISSIQDVYDWSYGWDKNDKDDIISITQSDTDTETVTANNVNGNATLIATTTITLDIINHTEGKIYSDYAEITNLLCLNPWPASPPYLDNDNYAKFSLFYCRDQGVEGKFCIGGTDAGESCNNNSDCNSNRCEDLDDLPGLVDPQPVGPRGDVLREYLLLRSDDSTDAIGIRIFDNPEHLSPEAWYEAQDWLSKSSPSGLHVDDYEAIRDGRSVYVAATTLTDSGTLYSNIYLISYNENASQDTIDIYNELLKNWTFNINVTDNRICSGGTSYCTLNSDCPSGETCDADKSKLIRDTKRITHLGAIRNWLKLYWGYCREHFNVSCSVDSNCPGVANGETCIINHGYYPKLEAGSYEIGHSTSKWPSWQQTLGSELTKSLPVDPINEFKITKQSCLSKLDCVSEICADGYCRCENNSGCNETSSYPQCYKNNCVDVLLNYDPESYWDETAKHFECFPGSHIYQYITTNSGQTYQLYANMEYEGAGAWGNPGNDTCQDYSVGP